MLKSFSFFLALAALFAFPIRSLSSTLVSTPADTQQALSAALQQQSDLPVRVIVPSIGLDAPIQGVGVNSLGQMDVPNGSTDNVGWYAFGTVPGQQGSAVLDAHVFAAFSKLKDLAVGSHILVEMSQGDALDFVVQQSQVYALAQVPLQQLFNRADAARLNLITCAGSLLPDGSTYDHRLIVYATLVEQS